VVLALPAASGLWALPWEDQAALADGRSRYADGPVDGPDVHGGRGRAQFLV
jgi:hypothetical protein